MEEFTYQKKVTFALLEKSSLLIPPILISNIFILQITLFKRTQRIMVNMKMETSYLLHNFKNTLFKITNPILNLKLSNNK